MQCETSFVPGVNQLVGCRGGFGEDAEPIEWILLVVFDLAIGRQRGAADTMETVTPGHNITLAGLARPTLAKRYPGAGAGDLMHGRISHVKADLNAPFQRR